jgi:hypothetical protein
VILSHCQAKGDRICSDFGRPRPAAGSRRVKAPAQKHETPPSLAGLFGKTEIGSLSPRAARFFFSLELPAFQYIRGKAERSEADMGSHGGISSRLPNQTGGDSVNLGHFRRLQMPRELIEPNKGDKRFIRRKGGKFTKSQDDVGKSLSADRRKKAKKTVKKGEGDRGDQKKTARRK